MEYGAEIITIGDEILLGQILDTNSQWIAQKLTDVGIKVLRKRTVSDNASAIIRALDNALQEADLIFITGGLGPTKDDITKITLSKYFEDPLVINETRLKELKSYYKSRGRELNDLNKTQALLPKHCFIVSNEIGTAAGMWFENTDKQVISMPGVPYEMKKMMEDTILPRISEKFDLPSIVFKTIRTIGVPESDLAMKLADWENNLPHELKLAYLPSLGIVKLRLTGVHDDPQVIEDLISTEEHKLHELIGEHIFGDGEDTIELVLGNILKEKGLTISTAESCTGGNIGHLLTSIPGSSSYYEGSVVSYSNEIKEQELSVTKESLKEHGAVSEEVVSQMAQNIKKKLNTDIGIATSGIAGPDGGTEEKPVGTIWIAYADQEGVVTKKLNLTPVRSNNIRMASIFALELARQQLVKK